MSIEVFQFEGLVYNVTGLTELAKKGGFKYGPHNAPINDNMRYGISGYVEPDPAIIDGMTIQRRDEPILVVELQNGMVRIVDGHHRLHRRMKDGLPNVWQYLIPHKDSLPFIHAAED
ncbi:ParB/Srx family N-terminal domain-containing protein [Neorhizobium tomejilense]|uniref:ParB/Srx family N-terminal domain-containing protein n=1 Tax=Neorhizobium tomejilense TaxID=2093828 RepID=UPI003ECDBE77